MSDLSSETSLIIRTLENNTQKVDKLSEDLSTFAKAVHELAMSTRYISKDVESLQQELIEVKKEQAELGKTMQRHQGTINLLNKIGDIVLKMLVPLGVVGSIVGGILYTYAGK